MNVTIPEFLIALAVGSALIGFWVALRFPDRTPENVSRALMHVLLSFGIGWAAVDMFSTLTGYGKTAALAGMFGFVLPALAYTFLAGAWFLQLVAGMFARYGRR